MTEQTIPVDDCIWLETTPCGCIIAAVIAHVPDAWTLTTAEEALQHFHPTERERRHIQAAGITIVPVTGTQYREQHQDRWRCNAHTRPTRPPQEATA